MTIRGILFDVDDTLVDYSGSARVGILKHLAAEGALDRFESADAAVALWRAIEEEEYPRFLSGELTFKGQQLVRTQRFLSHLGLAADDPAAWFARYAALRDTAWSAFPEVASVLRGLEGQVALGVVSNASLPYQTGKLRAVQLLHHFGDAILCSDEFGAAKPQAAIFHAGCELLGLPPEQVAYVGDRYDVDALGAREAGLRAYWLDRGGLGMHAGERIAAVGGGITVIRSLTELDSP
ncbi:HAD family hydrolase [Nocardia yunnanensis]|uniref:HAD family hydrolase n=1 Tax=Nocardia yunnanensis TaxID=2382165 RepID=A0A386ZBM2_9NOCA|nr:HAD family hydrolase [Nocardia yunnanensis]AYF73899.1 HAD family hydrolase [Nocardia yunnanensis]